MTNVSDAILHISGQQGSKDIGGDILEFFQSLPEDLDLASAAYYLNKEFKRNDMGIDNRVEIYTDADDYDDYYDYSGYDDDDEWYESEIDY